MFVWLRNFLILDHNIIPDLIVLRFDLAAHNRWKAVLGLTSNVSGNLWRDFLTLCCFTGTYGPDEIGLLSVNPSVVDTMAASIIAL